MRLRYRRHLICASKPLPQLEDGPRCPVVQLALHRSPLNDFFDKILVRRGDVDSPTIKSRIR